MPMGDKYTDKDCTHLLKKNECNSLTEGVLIVCDSSRKFVAQMKN